MKISWVKAENDNKGFKFAENFGLDVYKINNLDKIDNKIINRSIVIGRLYG